jgi:hypothetical protein
MGWSSFSVTSPSEGDVVALQLLEVANDPATWTLANFGATVIRRRVGDNDEFYFSPHSVAVFERFIKLHSGGPCNPPRARELVATKTSRMLLGFKTRWEPFAAPGGKG